MLAHEWGWLRTGNGLSRQQDGHARVLGPANNWMVDLDEKVTVKVAVELKGTPKGIGNGGVLDQHLAEIEVECLMTQIPDTLTPLVTHLDIGDTMLVGELELPPGVTALTNPQERLASVTVLAEEPEAAEEETESESAEPEIITKGKKEEETPGEKP